uniref:Beta-defensin-like domain-containing protein n=1 Tax=Podarcis muralis TaxID=64176 RepID=A0A670HN47_PODMU
MSGVQLRLPLGQELSQLHIFILPQSISPPAGFSIKISKRKDCMRARGRCFPLVCPWPLGYYIGECFWPIRRCCSRKK